uniref:DNA replication complex GINS protein PSF3 n=1 Tax=Felis catus TaxID=9685 RepID=A0ABI7VYM8_FELCA
MSEAYFRVESGALGPEENFLSLDDILMSHEKLPVRTETPMPRLGAFFLERSGGAETDHTIPQGSKLELPLWLAKGLFDHKRRILSVDLPKIYQQGWRTVFSADANVVDLHKLGPHFYGFGSQLLHFDSPENADISQSLLQVSPWDDLGCQRSGASLGLLGPFLLLSLTSELETALGSVLGSLLAIPTSEGISSHLKL